MLSMPYENEEYYKILALHNSKLEVKGKLYGIYPWKCKVMVTN